MLLIIFLFLFRGDTDLEIRVGVDHNDSTQYEHVKINPDQSLRLREWKYKLDDKSIYATTEYSDSSWQKSNLRNDELNEHKNTKWIRKSILLENQDEQIDYLALDIIGLFSAYEVYWDGHLIYNSGIVSNDINTEVIGDNHAKINIPRHLTQDKEHLIAIRISNQNYDESFSRFFRIKLGLNESILSEQNNYVTKQVLQAAVFFITALFCFGLFVSSSRKRPYVIFATLWTVYLFEIIITTSTLMSKEMNFFSYYLVDWIRAFTFIELSSIGLFIIYIFRLNRNYWLISSTLAIALIYTYFGSLFSFNISYIFSALIVIYAVYQRKKGSILILIGMVTHLTFAYLEAYGIVQFGRVIGHVLLVSFVLVAIAQRLKIQTELYQDSMLRSARLELELLKMNIKPHFLLNTLFSVMSWMEESPKVAKEIIKSLSEEFRLISKISSQKTISLGEELELCKYHLDLMGYRKNAKYSLNYHNINTAERVPPMIFHTLIENGLTHSFLSNEDGQFDLYFEQEGSTKKYKMVNKGSQIKEMPEDLIKEGIGLKYVKSRLEEAFTDKWKMAYGKHEDRWEVEIIIQS